MIAFVRAVALTVLFIVASILLAGAIFIKVATTLGANALDFLPTEYCEGCRK